MRYLAAAVILASAPFARGDTTDQEFYGTATYGSKLKLLTDGDKVSGTKVEFKIEWTMQPTTPGRSGPTVKDVFVEKRKITLGPEVIFDDVTRVGEGSVSAIQPKFRFASTFFSDGDTIPIKVEGTYLLQSNGVTVTKEYSKTYNLVAYNKVLRFSTNDSNLKFFAQPCVATTQSLAQSHSLTPDIEASKTMSKSEILAALKTSTVFFTSTHGTTTTYTDSEDIVQAANVISTSENNQAAYTSRTVPAFNFACMYSCATLAGGSTAWPTSFKLNTGQNKAFAGFTDVLAGSWTPPADINGNVGPDQTIADHATWLHYYLSTGSRLAEAINEANKITQPTVRMTFKGDGYMRLYLVYISESQWSNLTEEQRNKWYLRLS